LLGFVELFGVEQEQAGIQLTVEDLPDYVSRDAHGDLGAGLGVAHIDDVASAREANVFVLDTHSFQHVKIVYFAR
jgi:hypothetical protein